MFSAFLNRKFKFQIPQNLTDLRIGNTNILAPERTFSDFVFLSCRGYRNDIKNPLSSLPLLSYDIRYKECELAKRIIPHVTLRHATWIESELAQRIITHVTPERAVQLKFYKTVQKQIVLTIYHFKLITINRYFYYVSDKIK